MFSGPLFTRELITVPRDPSHFWVRSGYVVALCVLIYTGAQTTFGLVPMRSVGDIARFGAFVFQICSFIQLAIVLSASLLLSSGNVAQEKDRRTLIILLMTDLRTTELVIGKTLASLLPVFVLIAVSVPVFCLIHMLGGISIGQIVWVELICIITAITAGSWGTMVAYWREKTFQIIATTMMGAGLFFACIETAAVLIGPNTMGQFLGMANPFRGLWNVLNPLASTAGNSVAVVGAASTVSILAVLSLVIWVVTCLRVRVWNPSRVLHARAEEAVEPQAEAVHEGGAVESRSARPVWNLPIIWREICTHAYGRKIGLIKLAYYAVAVICILWMSRIPPDAPLMLGMISAEGFALVLLALIGLILINAQSVTSLTSERDGQTLELLLVTEVTAKEFVFGKLGGVFFNTKELIAVPLLLAFSSWFRGSMGAEAFVFVVLSFLILVFFAAMLGLHSGLSFDQSRAAILNSLGTMFFLFVGIFVCMMLIVEARSSFGLQLAPFLLFILGGSLGLWMSLTHKNPSSALTISAWTLPFITFYAITSFLLGDSAFVFLSIACAYGFTAGAMLIPAVSAFDLALGRATADR